MTLRRSGRSAVMSMGTIAIAFLTLGGFLLLSANVQSVVERWASAAEMSVYLRDDLGAADARGDHRSAQRRMRAVASVEFVSKDEAVERFKSDFPGACRRDGLRWSNRSHPSLEVRLRTDADVDRGGGRAMAGQLDHARRRRRRPL